MAHTRRIGLLKLADAAITIVATSEFVAVLIFCTIGLLLTLDVMLRSPVLVAFAV
jgi:hypothetical protein